jgi:hypothetical protein
MRNGQGGRRGRGRGGRPGQSGSHRIEQGSRNEARVRGNAHQLLEKYKNLARDAAAAGDRILAEYYMQHADHYFRVLAELRPKDDHRPRPQNYTDGFGDEGEDALEGVSNVDLNNPQSFAQSAAVQVFGADGPPTHNNTPHSDPTAQAKADEDEDEGEEDVEESAQETSPRQRHQQERYPPAPTRAQQAPSNQAERAPAPLDTGGEEPEAEEEEPRRRRSRRSRGPRTRYREQMSAANNEQPSESVES